VPLVIGGLRCILYQLKRTFGIGEPALSEGDMPLRPIAEGHRELKVKPLCVFEEVFQPRMRLCVVGSLGKYIGGVVGHCSPRPRIIDMRKGFLRRLEMEGFSETARIWIEPTKVEVWRDIADKIDRRAVPTISQPFNVLWTIGTFSDYGCRGDPMTRLTLVSCIACRVERSDERILGVIEVSEKKVRLPFNRCSSRTEWVVWSEPRPCTLGKIAS
jgi:hypothetical protein